MEEDSSVKAPVTRLRRRLSVEQSDDVKSPGPSTPTKKRGGRLAAKPQLELIDENAANLTPSKRATRKVSAQDTEAVEEKPVTPARRSTRIKSNTSIVSETTLALDSPRAKRAARRTSQVGSDSESSLTPIRQTRRNRKDSSSSIEKLEVTLAAKPELIIEVIIEEDTNSVKSDDTTKVSENSLTPPVRKSPRLKEKREIKDKKSIEKLSHENEVPSDNFNVSKEFKKKSEDNIEQADNKVELKNNSSTEDKLNVSKESRKKERKSKSNENDIEVELTNDSSTEDKLNISKETRKKERKSKSNVDDSNDTEDKLNVSKVNELKVRKSLENSDIVEHQNSANVNLDTTKQIESQGRKSVDKSGSHNEDFDNHSQDNESNVTKGKLNEKDTCSDSSLLMIKNLDKESKKISSNINKSTSALEIPSNLENKRHRTKSLTVTSLTAENDGAFYSDNESIKKKLKKNTRLEEFKIQSSHAGSGDSKNINKSRIDTTDENTQLDVSLHATDKKRISKEYMSPIKSSSDVKPLITETISPQGNKENILIQHAGEELNESEKFFQKAPTLKLQSTVYFEESDTDTKSKEGVVMQLDTEDQCVPVIDNQLVGKDMPAESDKKNDDGCEPMDIDETIPNNVSVTEHSLTKLKESKNLEQKSILDSPLTNNSINKSLNKSRRKSSLSSTQNLEKSGTENKSTLILSQLKDVSATEHNMSKSPKLPNDILSKSVNTANTVKDKALDKNDISQDYSTSTPLQQKRFQKLGMQINSSIIDSTNMDSKKASQNEVSKISRSSETKSDDDSDLENEEEESSKDKSSFLDDEAEEASEDYESGDSRDVEERQYEKENEIVERGETLDSDDDMSDDTDYEKDSFVVSSDEEDNELLSGSGDDLSMSDNELSMSNKSKKKYNERKQKEQKKASKEMYNSRHKLNDSDGVTKTKKIKKRQQIESSEDSEEEVVAPARRNRHLRLDSTHDDDLDKTTANDSSTKKKKKSSMLSKSTHDERTTQEQEISTISDENIPLDKEDPLSVQVKLEPKTPMKDFNISTVQINENIEEVEVDNNVSVIKTDEARDPFQATVLEEEEDSLSENSEIMNNYDSVLNELNGASKTKTVKSLDMSLNINKRAKKKNNEPIIDQLNLTKTKKQKNVSNVEPTKLNKSQQNNAKNTMSNSSSDSIDLRLLFSEDSYDCDDVKDKSNKVVNLKDTSDDNDFIPLKRTPGKTNILSVNNENSEASSMTESAKKKNKKRKSQATTEELPDSNDCDDVKDKSNKVVNLKDASDDNDFIPLKRTPGKTNILLVNNENSEASSMTESAKKKNKKRKSQATTEERAEDDPTNNNDIQIIIDTQGTLEGTEKSFNLLLNSSMKKKKNRNSVSFQDNEDNSFLHVATHDEDTPAEVPYESSKSKKKNRKSTETHLDADTSALEDEPENAANISNSNSAKKKKKRISESQTEKGEDWKPSLDVNISIGSSKKQKDLNTSETSLANIHGMSFNTSIEKTEKKKKKKLSETLYNEEDTETKLMSNKSLNISMGSAKKKKQKTVSESEAVKDDKEIDKNVSFGSAKKQKAFIEAQQIAEPLTETVTVTSEEAVTHTKKRKRKSSANEVLENEDNSKVPDPSQNVVLNESISKGSQKKKIKISQNEADNIPSQDEIPKKKSKKRKERDDDDGNSVVKMFKESSFDKICITRLPTSIISQLEDKPKKEDLELKKLAVTSTTPFIVEDTRKRRNKPSQFLEESVYLNDTHVDKKQKGNLKKPKVLPFIPTAVTSGSGFTTSFKINVIPQEVKFVAQTKNVPNFKNEYLYGKKIKRLGTYETYKKHRNAKISKF